METKTQMTNAQKSLLASLHAQENAAVNDPLTYSAGMAVGTCGCHTMVARSLVRMGVAVIKVESGVSVLHLTKAV